MEAFFTYLKEKHIRQDFKSTFDLSAKFRLPGPSQQQKSQFFEDEFNKIFKNFYQFLRKSNFLQGKTDAQVQNNIKNNIDQSQLVMEFDTWLELQGNQFTFVQKIEKPKPIHQSGSNFQPINSPYSAQTPVQHKPRYPATKTSEPKPFIISRPPQATPWVPPKQTQPTVIYSAMQQQQAPKTQPGNQPGNQNRNNNPSILPMTYYFYPALSNPNAAKEDKPYRVRFIEKLAEYFENPERANIIKSELTTLTNKKVNN